MKQKYQKCIAAICMLLIMTTILPVERNVMYAAGKTTKTKASEDASKYSMEGYAAASKVTGGGTLSETSSNYHKVANPEQFLAALDNAKKSGKETVIEITNDLALGSIEIGSLLTTYKSVIQEANNGPLLHPTLLKTGVSTINIKEMENLTIFSKNGSKLTHVLFNITNSSNIIIRNLVFDEIWEWDEDTQGDYDINDWDYMTVQNKSTGIWFDHCTFYRSYDGVIDVKSASSSYTTDVTISWCEFLPGSEGSFFDEMMQLLEQNPEKYPYYNSLITTYKMTKEQVRQYAQAQKKTHLIGASDKEANTENLRITLANNYYKNTMDRLPRMRGGSAHVYNCIMDASDVYDLRQQVTNSTAKSKIVSNGAISTCGGSVLVQNSYIDGIINALISGNGNSSAGYIAAMDSEYYLGGEKAELTITDKSGAGLELNTSQFLSALPYEAPVLYQASELKTEVLPAAGAGKLSWTSSMWMKTSYDAPEQAPEVTPTEKPTATPTEKPTETPTEKPTATPTEKPTATPTEKPTETPTEKPTAAPTEKPAVTPTEKPTAAPTEKPTEMPTEKPTETPTEKPTETPTEKPTETPTVKPTVTATVKPTATPTVKPTATPTVKPTAIPTAKPTTTSTAKPSAMPVTIKQQTVVLTAKNVSVSKNKLTWNRIKQADGYIIYRADQKGGSYKRIKVVSSGKTLSYTDKKVEFGKTYYYKVRAYQTKGTKTYYSKYSKVEKTKVKVSKVKGLVLKKKKRNITITWNKTDGDGYEIHRAVSPNGKYKRLVTIYRNNILTYTNKGLKRNTYYYKVRAYKMVKGKRVYGSWSAVKKIKL